MGRTPDKDRPTQQLAFYPTYMQLPGYWLIYLLLYIFD